MLRQVLKVNLWVLLICSPALATKPATLCDLEQRSWDSAVNDDRKSSRDNLLCWLFGSEAGVRAVNYSLDNRQMLVTLNKELRLYSQPFGRTDFVWIPFLGVRKAVFSKDGKSLEILDRYEVWRTHSFDWLKAFAISKACGFRDLTIKQSNAVRDYVKTEELIFGHQVVMSKYLLTQERQALLGSWCSKLENWWKI